MQNPTLAFATLVAFATTAAAANAATLTYTGAYFDTVSYSGPPHPGSDKPPVGPYSTADRVTAVIELDIDVAANWSMKDMTPHIVAFHTLTDGVVDFVNVNVPYVLSPIVWLELSTDADGNITDWGLGAVAGSTDFIALMSTKSGDDVQYRYETGYFDPGIPGLFSGSTGMWCCTGEVASAGSGTPGTWSVAATVVPLPGALPAMAGAIGLVGLIGYGRRRR